MGNLKITIGNKISIIPQGDHVNQYWAEDFNQQKEVINAHADSLDSAEARITQAEADVIVAQAGVDAELVWRNGNWDLVSKYVQFGEGSIAGEMEVFSGGAISVDPNGNLQTGKTTAQLDLAQATEVPNKRFVTDKIGDIKGTDIPYTSGSGETIFDKVDAINDDVNVNTQHRGLLNNPHNVTSVQVGAISSVNGKIFTTNNGGAIYISGESIELEAGDGTSIFDAFESLQGEVSPNTTHRGQTDNPHNVTAVQVGAQKEGNIGVDVLTASASLGSSHKGKVMNYEGATDIVITINENSLSTVGDIAYFDQIGAGNISFVAGAGAVLQANASRELITDGQFSRVAVQFTKFDFGANQYRIFGELKAL